MRNIILISLGTIYTSFLFGQDFDLGGKIGVNYSQSIISNVISDGGVDESDFENEAGIGIVFGGFARATFGKLMLQPELLFSQNKSYVKLDDISADDIFAADISKIDIPVLVGYKAFNLVRLMAGPVFSNIRESDSDPLFQFDNITVGYQAGVGFDISRLTFDVRYEGNLQALENYIETDNGVVQFDSRKNVFQFTAGFKLFD